MLDKATKFILSILTENDEIKKFPKEFVDASVKWIRAWFLKDEPTLAPVLDAKGEQILKAKIIALKLPQLWKDEQFAKELSERMAAYQRMKNVIIQSKVDVKGNVDIGDRNIDSNDDGTYSTKNVISGSQVTVGGDLNIGDKHETIIKSSHTGSGDIVHGSKINTTNNYYGNRGSQPEPGYKSGVKTKIQALIGQGELEESVTELIEYAEKNNNKIYNDALQLSGRYYMLKNKENRGVISEKDVSLEQNKIRMALLGLLEKL